MSNAEFDAYTDVYEDQHASSIRLSGERPDYFADYKIRVLAGLANDWGLTAPVILDFGSGIGNSLPGYRRHMPTASVTLSDVSAQSLETARNIHGGDEAMVHIADGALDLPDACFDITFTACVFHHIPPEEHAHWLGELRRVTRPGGHIVIFEHNPLNPLTLHAVRNCPFDENAILIRAGEMRRRLKRAGWHEARTDFHVFFPAALSSLRGLEPGLTWCPLGAQYAAIATA